MTLVGTTTCHGSLLWMRSNASVITHRQIISNHNKHNKHDTNLLACFLEVGQVLSNNLLMCKPCGRCKWLQKLPCPPQQQVQWVNKRAFTNTSFHERCHWQSFCISESLAHQLLHFPIRDNLLRIRHLHMLLVRNTKTSLTCKLIALHQLYMVLRKPIFHISAILKLTNFGSFSANPWHISDSCNFAPFICKAHLAPPQTGTLGMQSYKPSFPPSWRQRCQICQSLRTHAGQTLCKGYQQCHLHEFQLHLQYLILVALLK